MALRSGRLTGEPASLVAAGVLFAAVSPPPPSHTFAALVRHRLESRRVQRREAGRAQAYAPAPQSQDEQFNDSAETDIRRSDSDPHQ